VAPEAAKVGGDFAVRVRDQAELDELLEQLRAATPVPGLEITGVAAPSLEEARKAHGTRKAELEAAGKRAPRGARPLGLAAGAELQLPDVAGEASALPGALQERATGLTDEQAFSDLYVEQETGLLTAQGWAAIPRKKFVASLDLNGLKSVNAALGDAFGDRMLREFGRAIRDRDGARFDAAHLHGDEYAAQADSREELDAFLAGLAEVVEGITITAELPDGELVGVAGLTFGRGVGDTLERADEALNQHKRQLAAEGKRGPEADADRLARGARAAREEAAAGRKAQGSSRGDQRPAVLEGREAGRAQRFGGVTLRQGERGYVQIAQEGARRLFQVVLKPGADLSTFLHESGHIFLEMMGDLAGHEKAPAQLQEDWAAVLKWLGVVGREEIKVEHHEKWAKTFEAYLFEGKAPSAALSRAFARFRLWMREVYRSLTSLGGPVPEEIRGVFDRLLATDAEIDRAKRAMGLQPMFRSPADAGMTPEQWQAYLSAQERAHSTAQLRATTRVLRDKLRETEAWWTEQERELAKEAGKEFDALPAFRATKYLAKAELDASAVAAAVAPDAAKRFRTGKDGEHPDDVAELFGFATGQAMLEAVARLPARDVYAAEHAAERMRDQYPDILEERDKLRELVAKGLHGEDSADWLLRELAALRQRAYVLAENPEANTQQAIPRARLGMPPPPVEAIKAAAKQIAERETLRRLEAGTVLAAERHAADRAVQAVAKGEWARAYAHKQQQLLNHYLYRELSEARELRDDLQELAGELSKDKARARLGKASPVYRDAVDQLLEVLEL
jgi:GGDEF domain-containing protein